ncbi:DUF6069 family protein [Nocardia arizonensis]|uniref:DUF6069 family protein n=1 Tax=Nocardia arizonensis TaxID=1141647 RepID=UPI0006D2A2CD|nr:DUF6069 family protein [Nocardia arizonensis]
MADVTTTAPSLPVPSLNRLVAVVGAVLAALAVNSIIWLIGMAAGGEFVTVDNGTEMKVAPGGVVVMSTVPLLIGLGAAALISYRWVGVLRVAAVIGSLLTLGTIAMTIEATFDTASTIALSLMHVALVPVLVFATEGLRNRLVAD